LRTCLGVRLKSDASASMEKEKRSSRFQKYLLFRKWSVSKTVLFCFVIKVTQNPQPGFIARTGKRSCEALRLSHLLILKSPAYSQRRRTARKSRSTSFTERE